MKILYVILILRQTVLYYVLKGMTHSMKIAEVGNIIEFKDGLQGSVHKVNENSVIELKNPFLFLNELETEEKTVINHKRYKILYSNED